MLCSVGCGIHRRRNRGVRNQRSNPRCLGLACFVLRSWNLQRCDVCGDRRRTKKLSQLNVPFSRTHELKVIVNDNDSCAEEAVEEDHKTPLQTPWRGIVTNKSVIATAFFKFAQAWVATIMGTKLPVYLKDVMHQSIKANGIINAGACLLTGISLMTVGYLSERVIERKWLERTRCRKMFSLVTGTGTGIVIMCIPAAGCSLPALLTVVFFYAIVAGFKAGSDVPSCFRNVSYLSFHHICSHEYNKYVQWIHGTRLCRNDPG